MVSSAKRHPQGACVDGKVGCEKKVTEYDGKVSFNAYQAKYEDVKALVRGTYPTAKEDTVDMLAKDCFVDTLQDRELQIHVKQVAPRNVHEALARAVEFETFLVSSGPVSSSPNNDSDWMSRPKRQVGAQNRLRCRQVAASDAIKVAGSINERQVEMVVDTGVKKTFVREGVLPGRGVRCEGKQLCGVTGDCIQVKRPVWVDLIVGKVTEHLPVILAKM
ncbi:hypothetical protein E2C01_047552 [Portunus trituberculatus]|uniref:Peptidase A2 domain-containing protein n=1 Tax=Portunus trituberculatus TaxID=210409 RepID=A0A5B7GAU3_PORTR|nr:hypothetical protein [Portunus trituberculatus]